MLIVFDALAVAITININDTITITVTFPEFCTLINQRTLLLFNIYDVTITNPFFRYSGANTYLIILYMCIFTHTSTVRIY